MPDHAYEISAVDRRGVYVMTQGSQRINLPEGGSAELTLNLRKRSKPPEVGQPAPPFAVKTLGGRELSLSGLRGKLVLIHFWAPARGITGLPSLKAIHARFGKDERFVMLGLCVADRHADAESVIKASGLTWPQAVLRDSGADALELDYVVRRPYPPFLIGPDGRLIAKDLQGEPLEKAVAQALGRK